MSTTVRSANHFRLGLMFAVGSAFTFGMSGPFAKSLMVAGWSPTAAVTARLAGGALVMVIFATVVKPDWIREAATARPRRHRLRPGPDRRCPAVLLQRRLAPVRRRRAAAGVHRADPGRRLDLDHHPAPAARFDPCRGGPGGRGHHVGAQRCERRCQRQRRRSGVGPGRRDLRGLLLHDVRRGHRRRQRTELRSPCRPVVWWSAPSRSGCWACPG